MIELFQRIDAMTFGLKIDMFTIKWDSNLEIQVQKWKHCILSHSFEILYGRVCKAAAGLPQINKSLPAHSGSSQSMSQEKVHLAASDII